MSSRKMILVVDDEPDFRAYLSALLEDNGYETMTAEDGEDGLKKLEQCRPDLVTLDVTMPTKSGVKLYRELKESAEYNTIPVIMITGISSEFETFISTRKQVPPPDGYLSKPIDREAFLAEVGKHLRVR